MTRPMDNPHNGKRWIQRKRQRRLHDYMPGPYNAAIGETAMWRAVITQAMMDALSRAASPAARYQRHEAIHWLTGGGRDFADVCLMAGWEPSAVRSKAKRTLSSPQPWRADSGRGWRYEERKARRKRQRAPEPPIPAVQLLPLEA